NYQDLWYASPAESESGWGVNFAQQGDTVFATWFTYEASGAPMWLVAVAPRTGANAFAGTLFRTTGPAFDASPFRPERVTRTPVGDVTITFASGNAGTFRYSVNGVTQSKSITRQVFRAPGTTCQYAEGVWKGATDRGEAAVVVVLEGGSHFIYWGSAGGSGGHVVHGTARMDAGSFSSPHSLDYPVALAVETSDATSNYAISGTYAPGGDIVLSLAGDAGARKLTATFDAASTGSPDLAAVAGSYAGISGHVNGRRSATFAVAESGTVTGRNDRCTFRGRLTPRQSPAVFDFTLSAIGPCIFGTVNGIAQYHEPTRELRMFGLFAGGIDMYYVIGARQ
ncbi:MAG TPA: hypothetical protein VFK48_06500, partial [Usitatibacter sp.]|nr:hypothetical protein [Usitatibacter sp.]